jgi:hypothetical protein
MELLRRGPEETSANIRHPSLLTEKPLRKPLEGFPDSNDDMAAIATLRPRIRRSPARQTAGFAVTALAKRDLGDRPAFLANAATGERGHKSQTGSEPDGQHTQQTLGLGKTCQGTIPITRRALSEPS